MWDIPRLVMAVSGLGMIVIGIRRKKMWEAGCGFCIAGSALSGYLAKTNDAYAWFEWPFVVALVALVLARLVRESP